MKKISGLILAFTLLLMSVGLAFGQTTNEKKPELVVQVGHSNLVNTVVFSPDGKIAASGSSDNGIKLWNVENGQLIKTLTGHKSGVLALAFSPDGKMLASGSYDETIKLWNIESGKIIKSLIDSDNEESYGWTVAFSPDGKMLASENHFFIKLWNIETGQKINSFEKPSGYIKTVVFSPNGDTLVSTNDYGAIIFWDVKTGKIIKSIDSPVKSAPNSILYFAFFDDGKKIFSASQDGTINLWNIETGKLVDSLKEHATEVKALKFSPEEQILTSVSVDKTINSWNLQTGRLIKTIELQKLDTARQNKSLESDADKIHSAAFSPDGKTLVSGGFGTVKFWNAENGRQINPQKGYIYQISSVAVSPDGKLLASGNFNTINLWNLQTGNQIKTLEHGNWVESIAFSPDGKMLASASFDKTINLWNVETGQVIKTLRGHISSIYSIKFSPDGKTLASGSADKTIKLWSVETGQVIDSFENHRASVKAVAFSPSGKAIASASFDGTIKLWNIETGQVIYSLETDDDSIFYSVAFSPDGKTLASGGDNNDTKLWNVETGQPEKILESHDSTNSSMAFSTDGKTIIGGRLDGKIDLWNAANGRKIKSLENHSANITSLTFSPDGRFFVSSSADGAIKLWNGQTNEILATLVSLNDNDWMVVDAAGRFDASEGALKLMHYTYGLEIINLEQLKEIYYEPGLLQKLLGFNKEPLRPIVPLSDVKLYPEVVEQTVAPNSTKLTVKLKNRGGGIGAVQVFVGNRFGNKLAVEDARDAKLRANPNVAEATLTVDLQGTGYLKGEENEITVVTSNYLKEIGKGNIQSRGSKLVWTGAGKEEEYELPTLYAIVGGVSDYAGENLDLRFAAKDAEDFSNALSLGAKRLFCDKATPDCIDKVNITTLSTSGNAGTILPTKENFIKAFREVASKAKPEDIVVIYLAGHGVSFGVGTDSYFYLTQEARTTSREDLAKVLTTSAISSDELSDWLTANTQNADDIFIKAGKQVIILDTCASGNAAEKIALSAKRDLSGDQIRAVEFLKDKTGTFVLMASTADAPSYEASEFGQGLLTYSLLQAMQGAALGQGGYIDVQQLFAYAQKEVPQMATNIGGVQKPIVSAPLGKTFTIGQMTDAETKQINLPSRKPRMLRPLLTSPPINNDPLKLIPELRKGFDAESSYEVVRQRGDKEPQLIYIDDDSFPGAVRVTGTYTVEGENVRVKAYLIKDEKVIAELREFTVPQDKAAEELIIAIRTELAKLK